MDIQVKAEDKGAERAPDKIWYQALLARKQLTQTAVAAQMGVDPATLSYAVNGTRALKVKEATDLARILEVPVTEVMRRWGYEVPPEAGVVPVTHYLRDDMSAHALPDVFMTITAPPGFPADGFAAQVRTSLHVGGFWDGVFCFFAPGVYRMEQCEGRLSLVETADGRSLFGEVSRPYNSGVYSLTHPATRCQIEDIQIVRAIPASWFRAM